MGTRMSVWMQEVILRNIYDSGQMIPEKVNFLGQIFGQNFPKIYKRGGASILDARVNTLWVGMYHEAWLTLGTTWFSTLEGDKIEGEHFVREY